MIFTPISFGKKLILAKYQLACFILAGYMAYQQFQAYSSNQDVSYVSHKKFVDDNQDVYPTFSVCAFGNDRVGPIISKRLPSKYTGSDYIQVMRGNLHDDQNYSSITFDHVVANLKTSVNKFYTTTTEGKIIRRRSKNLATHSNSSIAISHLDPNQICVTKEKDFPSYGLIKNEHLYIDSVSIEIKHLDLHFYVHQRGHLIRSLGHPNFVVSRQFISNSLKLLFFHSIYEINLHIVANDVLRKRPDAKTPCNPNLQDEDNQLRYSVIQAMGCIPAFMRRFITVSSLPKNISELSTCSKEQYKKIDSFYSHFENAAALYVEPCTHLSSIVTTSNALTKITKGFGSSKFDLKFNLEYSVNTYKETLNKKAFDLASLWSQIGGFIGIFLGYSLLQIPQLARDVIELVKAKLGSRNVKRYYESTDKTRNEESYIASQAVFTKKSAEKIQVNYNFNAIIMR